MAGPGLEEAGLAAARRQAAVLRPELEQGRSWGSVDGACPLLMGHREGPAAPHGAQLRRQGSTHTQAPVPADPALGASEGQRGSRTWRAHRDSPAPRDGPRRAPAGRRSRGQGHRLREGRTPSFAPKAEGGQRHPSEAARSLLWWPRGPNSGRSASPGQGSGSEQRQDVALPTSAPLGALLRPGRSGSRCCQSKEQRRAARAGHHTHVTAS